MGVTAGEFKLHEEKCRDCERRLQEPCREVLASPGREPRGAPGRPHLSNQIDAVLARSFANVLLKELDEIAGGAEAG